MDRYGADCARITDNLKLSTLTYNAHLGQLRGRRAGGIGPKSLVRVADYSSK
jgi:hypothetical protein